MVERGVDPCLVAKPGQQLVVEVVGVDLLERDVDAFDQVTRLVHRRETTGGDPALDPVLADSRTCAKCVGGLHAWSATR